MKRRLSASGGVPEELARYDWRDWRPEPEPDDLAPWYSCWYLGLFDWRQARRAWAAERGVDERALPERVTPPEPDLLTASKPEPGQVSNTSPVREEPGQGSRPRVNRGTTVHRSRPIKLR
ncbi:hypothetical protein ABZX30_28805 [Streptomyces sp. NPDC004542]|uniref:hypothetical protein n=1 Tax=Streptomyces sp. NPDC004542 TaxID=3154281 RepID=UPI0033B08CED